MRYQHEVSIGIITYNDNINNILSSISKQEQGSIKISEIIIVSVNKNKQLIEKIIKKYKYLPINLIFEKYRKGKYSAVNKFLLVAKKNILVLCSGDIVLKEDSIEKLCNPLLNDARLGIVASHPIPFSEQENLLQKINKRLWELHDQLAMISPKFGELIAFRNLHFKINKTGADEERIAMIITKKGYSKEYARDSLIYNSGPKTFFDYICQRRRIFCSHLQLERDYNCKIPTTIYSNLIKVIFNRHKLDFILFMTIFLEIVSRTLGFIDYCLGRDYYLWKIIEKDNTL